MYGESLSMKKKKTGSRVNKMPYPSTLQAQSIAKKYIEGTNGSCRKKQKRSKSKRLITEHFQPYIINVVKQARKPESVKKNGRSSSVSKPFYVVSTEMVRKDSRQEYIKKKTEQNKKHNLHQPIPSNYSNSHISDLNTSEGVAVRNKCKIRSDFNEKIVHTLKDFSSKEELWGTHQSKKKREEVKKQQHKRQQVKKQQHKRQQVKKQENKRQQMKKQQVKKQQMKKQQYKRKDRSKKKAHSRINLFSAEKQFQKPTSDSTPKIQSMDDLQPDQVIGEGTFGKVFRCRIKRTGQYVAVKRVFQDPKYKNREVQIVSMLQNLFVMRVYSTFKVQDTAGQWLNIVMECYEGDLHALLKKQKLSTLDIKIISYQIFRGLLYIHSKKVAHRDIKPHNILLKDRSVVICDFGSAKVLCPNECNLPYICSRCYRAPQLLFGAKDYTTQIDIWSTGCVLLQMMHGCPLFLGNSSVDHLIEIIKVLGTPTKKQVLEMNATYNMEEYNFPRLKKKQWFNIFPNIDQQLHDLLNGILVYSPQDRMTAVDILCHPFYDELRQKEVALSLKTKYNLDLLTFSQEELTMHKDKIHRLIPPWCTH